MFPMLHPARAISDLQIYTGLRCYSDRIIGSFNSGLAPTCDYIFSDIKESPQTNISIYPNPTDNYLNIKTENPALIKNITLSNLAGQLLISNGTNAILDMGDLPVGTYLLQVKTADGNINKLVNKID